MRLVIAFGTLLAASIPATASGGLSCEADDADVRFAVATGVSHTIGSFFNFRVTLEIAVDGVPAELRSLELDRDALIHSWLDADEARLWLHHERAAGDFASVDLVIETEAAGEDGDYRGTYRLTVAAVGEGGATEWSAEGAVTCFSE